MTRRPALRLGNKTIARDCRETYIIAEIGVNHEGDLSLAKKLIDLAKEGGADAAKFQAYKAGKIASRNSPAYWDTTKESTRSQFELFKKYDGFGEAEYRELHRHCERAGIDFLCTAFDLEAVEFLDPMMAFHKIASADLTNVPLLRAIARKGKPVALSTGAASFAEIHTALGILHENGATDVTLLHCVLNYPTPNKVAFLGRIATLGRIFPDYVIGYSDHTLPFDACFPVQMAHLLGARVIEKHFTHDKTLPGNDHYHAMDANDLRALRKQLDLATTLLGDDSERVFLASQDRAITHARRSVVLATAVKEGETLAEKHLIAKRPGHGISPLHWDSVVGRKARADLPEDHILQWSDLA